MSKGLKRITWSKTEKEILLKTFLEEPYLTEAKLAELICTLGRANGSGSIKTWFRNERRRRGRGWCNSMATAETPNSFVPDHTKIMSKDEEHRNTTMEDYMVSSMCQPFEPVAPVIQPQLPIPFMNNVEQSDCAHCGNHNPVPMEYIFRLAQQMAAYGPVITDQCNPYL